MFICVQGLQWGTLHPICLCHQIQPHLIESYRVMLPQTVVLCLPESGFSSASSAGTCLLVINAPCLVLCPSSLSHKILKSLRQKLCPVQLVVPVEASTEPQQATGTQEMLDTLTKVQFPKNKTWAQQSHWQLTHFHKEIVPLSYLNSARLHKTISKGSQNHRKLYTLSASSLWRAVRKLCPQMRSQAILEVYTSFLMPPSHLLKCLGPVLCQSLSKWFHLHLPFLLSINF